jgi:hypothetical protein
MSDPDKVPMDMLTIAGMNDERDEEILRVHDSVRDLVTYRWYRQHATASDRLVFLPSGLQKFVHDEFTRLRLRLPGDQQATLARWKLTLDKPPDYASEVLEFPSRGNLPTGVLWMQARDGYIYLSPGLVRALFMEATIREQLLIGWYHEFGRALNATPDGKQGRLTFEVLEAPNSVERLVSELREALQFPLAHEMAHVFIYRGGPPGSGTETSEQRVDCYALAFMQAIGEKLTLGAFERLLVRALDEGVQSLWLEGQQSALQIRSRLAFIREWSQSPNIEEKCQQLDRERWWERDLEPRFEAIR